MSKERVEPAYVLHARPFQETSLIVDVLTRHYGRLSLVAKGAKRPRSSKQALLQAFSPVMIAWVGKSELHTLTMIEARAHGQRLQGDALMCGLYLNELLVKLLDKHDAYPQIYDLYETVLVQLSQAKHFEEHLRRFELGLLKHLGYELSARDLDPEAYYMFSVDSGFIKAIKTTESVELFKGADLFSILHNDILSGHHLPIAKRLMRSVIQSLLQGKSLHSRNLFLSGEKLCQM